MFDQCDADGPVILLDAMPPCEERDATGCAVYACPPNAITIEADEE